jgi:hypothetical protein
VAVDIEVTSAVGGLNRLGSVETLARIMDRHVEEAMFRLDDHSVMVQGSVANHETMETMMDLLAAAVPGAEVDNQLILRRSYLGETPRDALDRLLARGRIRFEVGSDIFAPYGVFLLDRLVEILERWPRTEIQVVVPVHRPRGIDLDAALQLRRRRIGAVLDYLVTSGLGNDRIRFPETDALSPGVVARLAQGEIEVLTVEERFREDG